MKKIPRLNVVFFKMLMVLALSIGISGCEQGSDQQIIYPDPPTPTVLDEPGEFEKDSRVLIW